MTLTAAPPAPVETRRLVTRATIGALEPIAGADLIEVATVRGWEVVVRKGEFSVGQDVFYFEIDSALPVSDPRFAFLADRSTKNLTLPGGDPLVVHVLKTIKLRGTYSQGLVIAASEFPELAGYDEADLGAVLGVTKWEPRPQKENLTTKGGGGHRVPFPSFIVKTDAERVQNLSQRTWGSIRDDPAGWYAVEKIDGTSLTVWRDYAGAMHVASRNWELVCPHARPVARRGLVGWWQRRTGRHDRDLNRWLSQSESWRRNNLYWSTAWTYALNQRLMPGEWVQGEIAGDEVQGNPLGLPDVRLYVFGFGHINGTRYPWHHWPQWAVDGRPPIYDFDLPDTIKETVAQVEKLKSLVAPGKDAEGVVWTRADAFPPAGLGRPVFKSISAKYLLKHS